MLRLLPVSAKAMNKMILSYMARRHRLNDQLNRYEEKLTEYLPILSLGKLWFACTTKNLIFFFLYMNEYTLWLILFNQNFRNSYLGLIGKRE